MKQQGQALREQGQASKLFEEQSLGIPRPESAEKLLEPLGQTLPLQLAESATRTIRRHSHKGPRPLHSTPLQQALSGTEQTAPPNNLIRNSLADRSNQMSDFCLRLGVGADPSNAQQKQD